MPRPRTVTDDVLPSGPPPGIRVGDIKVVDANGQIRARIDSSGRLRVDDLVVTNSRGRTELFRVNRGGDIVVKELNLTNRQGTRILHVDRHGNVNLGGEDTKAQTRFWDADGELFAVLQPSMLLLYDTGGGSADNLAINLNALGRTLSMYNAHSETTIIIDADNSALRLANAAGDHTVLVDAENGNLLLGGNDTAGDILLFPRPVDHTKFEGVTSPSATIHLDGNNGDISLRNGDCAEDFEILDVDQAEPGTVMVIEEQGKLRQSAAAYDRRVAGVVSGAGDQRAGIVLGRDSSREHTVPIALAGTVYCKTTAERGPLRVGDLLTTSDTPGHAMKATDRTRSFGAVIGKTLAPLEEDRGLVPILVGLQ